MPVVRVDHSGHPGLSLGPRLGPSSEEVSRVGVSAVGVRRYFHSD